MRGPQRVADPTWPPSLLSASLWPWHHPTPVDPALPGGHLGARGQRPPFFPAPTSGKGLWAALGDACSPRASPGVTPAVGCSSGTCSLTGSPWISPPGSSRISTTSPRRSSLWKSKVWGLVLGAVLCMLPQSYPFHGPAILIFFSEGNGYSPICILLCSMDFAVNVMVSAVERHEQHLNENRHYAFRAGSLGRWLQGGGQTPGHCPFLYSVSHSLYAL